MQTIWQVITPEFPPQSGGVSDYTMQVANGLRHEGDEVHVWCPKASSESSAPDWIHRGQDWMSRRSMEELGRKLDEFPQPRRLLVQWVPHGYGLQTMNLPFCFWLLGRARRGDVVEIMLHEAFLAFGEGTWKQDAAALVHRMMTVVLLQAASRVWMSTPAWDAKWKPYRLGRKVSFVWLPIPSNVPVMSRPTEIVALRSKYAPADKIVLGHFGTFGKHITEILNQVIPPLLIGHRDRVVHLVGRGSEEFRRDLIERNQQLENQVSASGALEISKISPHLAICDLLLQPYPDGATTRRTSLMAGLAHGIPTLTNSGRLTEDFWAESSAVSLSSSDDWGDFVVRAEQLLKNPEERVRLGRRGRDVYGERFEVSRIVAALRGQTSPDLAVHH